MNKEEIEELKDFTIDLTDIDELALGLEVCSKKSNMVIQEFADTIIQLQQENKQLKEDNFRLQARSYKYKCKLDKLKFAIKSNCIKDGNKYQEICCDGDYLLSIIDGSDEE